MSKYNTVFECYPGVDEIYVVNEMPFIERKEADKYAKSVSASVQVIARKSAKSADSVPVVDPEGAPEKSSDADMASNADGVPDPKGKGKGKGKKA